MNTCKTCKHWFQSGFLPPTTPIGICQFIDMCYSAKQDQSKLVKVDVEMSDDSGLSVSLVTGENFGCVHHVPL